MIRAIIVDDEMAAVGNLADLLAESGRVKIAGEFTNPLKALEKVKQTRFDVAFLDIEMPGIHGMALANQILDVVDDVDIVFVTAYSEYAVDAFALDALDYLVKPVLKGRLKLTLDRVSARMSARSRSVDSTLGHLGKKLRVRCFGKFGVEDAQGEWVKWRTNKTEELFAYLVDMAGKEVGRDKLVDAIWGDFDERRALTNFSTCLYYLRRTLKEAGFPELLQCANGRFALDMGQIDCDVVQFERCAAGAFAIDEAELLNFEAVVEQGGLGYFEANYYEWAEPRRRRLEEQYLQQTIRLAAYFRDTGRELKAVEALKRGLEKDGVHTGLNTELIILYARMGDPLSARAHYNGYKNRLAGGYGMVPDNGLVQIVERL
jgi:two-component SAPR family response regulator